jgi:hypothetical protein
VVCGREANGDAVGRRLSVSCSTPVGSGARGDTHFPAADPVVVAVLPVAAPFMPATETGVTGAVLCGFALGWATLAVFSREIAYPLS